MQFAYPVQKFQDWFTQQWVIFWGKRIEPKAVSWLMGPFGNLGSIGDQFIDQLALSEGLIIERNSASGGLLSSIHELKLPHSESVLLSRKIVDFYENTACYKLTLSVQWNPLFKIFGKLVMLLFSNRIKQLNIPVQQKDINEINSEIITLRESGSGRVKYTIWYRTFKATGQVLYSGIYTTCALPSGEVCIKAVFPLPKGNATVIMLPRVGSTGELFLDASGNKFGDPGFYFLLQDSKGGYWSQYVRSFRDKLLVQSNEENIVAEQTLTLWHLRVLRFNYKMHRSTFATV